MIDTFAIPDMPSARAALGVRSITRPRTNGPRSFILTVTERPLFLWVTATTVPKGRLRCAAVSASSCSCSPLAVPFPDDRSYTDANPVRPSGLLGPAIATSPTKTAINGNTQPTMRGRIGKSIVEARPIHNQLKLRLFLPFPPLTVQCLDEVQRSMNCKGFAMLNHPGCDDRVDLLSNSSALALNSPARRRNSSLA